jgi:NAD-dependent deacetylase
MTGKAEVIPGQKSASRRSPLVSPKAVWGPRTVVWKQINASDWFSHFGNDARLKYPNKLMCSDTQNAVNALRRSTNALVITGAGISAESGIPTFRGQGGFWRSHDAAKLATWQAFKEDPKTVWEWYDYRRRMIAQAQPNAAHLALAALERNGKRVFIVTQNVDDLHERAGSREVAHLHGSIWEVTCLAEHRTYGDRQVPLSEIPPKCHCGGPLRPNIVWFDEELPLDVVKTIDAYYHDQKPDIVLVIGTEATFDYIRSFVQRAKEMGTPVVEINPTSTAVTPMADFVLRQKATEALSKLVNEVDI